MISRAVTGNSQQTLTCKQPTQRRLDMARKGMAGLCNARQAWRGVARPYLARKDWQARQGVARTGQAWRSIAGKAGRGEARQGMARRGKAKHRRRGWAGRGAAGTGKTQTASERAGYKWLTNFPTNKNTQ